MTLLKNWSRDLLTIFFIEQEKTNGFCRNKFFCFIAQNF